jgi:hypothetical protein
MSHNQRTRLMTALVLGLVFLAGVAMGMLVDRPFDQAVAVEAPPAGAEPETPEAESSDASDTSEEDGARKSMIHEVGLSPDQQVRADSILDVYRGLLQDFRDEYNPRYWAIVDGARAALREILTDDQVAVYDALVTERDRARGRTEPRT